ncbi:hypothetical protein AAC03nite_15370 [Alicyclobacillus acidoterrestris]|uniref:endonuclease Q family protein n=1 Tax=Alicyclobacillus suci TaxID=2816080 RepID=UPI00118EBA23|nr:endonuclease Q family protein [Alicyclobacillus suci]GEO25752.1 hypothetical protein AAC03nite_15370 [Alicyclobacillus acidoterrestris]
MVVSDTPVNEATTLHEYDADFHIHVGRALGKPVKIAAGASLTLENLLHHAAFVKGLDIITVIDGVCDNVLVEVDRLTRVGELASVAGGGLMYRDRMLVLLGAEVELAGPSGNAAHFGCWFADYEHARDFNQWLKTVQKNTQLSSQRAWTDALTLQTETHAREGLFIVHHAFTPFKGLLGSCVRRVGDFLDLGRVDALELGLSSDTEMADRLSELSRLTFVTNSDAHGVANIAREYNRVQMAALNFREVAKVLNRVDGRGIAANYGLHPEQGKYYRTRCRACDEFVQAGGCRCGTTLHHVYGVKDRLEDICDLPDAVHPAHRPPYFHHIPLLDIPGLGPGAYRKLLAAYGTELAVRRTADESGLVDVVGERLGRSIARALNGDIHWEVGGAGTYGKVIL